MYIDMDLEVFSLAATGPPGRGGASFHVSSGCDTTRQYNETVMLDTYSIRTFRGLSIWHFWEKGG